MATKRMNVARGVTAAVVLMLVGQQAVAAELAQATSVRRSRNSQSLADPPARVGDITEDSGHVNAVPGSDAGTRYLVFFHNIAASSYCRNPRPLSLRRRADAPARARTCDHSCARASAKRELERFRCLDRRKDGIEDMRSISNREPPITTDFKYSSPPQIAEVVRSSAI